MDLRRLLVLRLSSAGDILQTLPAVKALRACLPEASVDWLVDDRHARLLRGQPEADRLFVHPRGRWSGALRSPARAPSVAAETLALARSLRSRRYDAALDFQGNLKSGLWSLLSGAERRVGFARSASREGNALFHTVRVQPPARRLHRVRKYLCLLEGLGLRAEEAPSGYRVEDGARRSFLRFLGERGGAGARAAVFSPSTSSFGAYKRWSEEKWGRLARMLREETGVLPVFPAGPGEEGLALRLRQASEEALEVPERALPFGELAAFVEGAQLFVGVDSAPLHLAHLMRKPVVALFGPTDPALYAPFLGPSEVVAADLPCMPCRTRGCAERRCMEALTPEAVMSRLRSLLEREGLRRLA